MDGIVGSEAFFFCSSGRRAGAGQAGERLRDELRWRHIGFRSSIGLPRRMLRVDRNVRVFFLYTWWVETTVDWKLPMSLQM